MVVEVNRGGWRVVLSADGERWTKRSSALGAVPDRGPPAALVDRCAALGVAYKATEDEAEAPEGEDEAPPAAAPPPVLEPAAPGVLLTKPFVIPGEPAAVAAAPTRSPHFAGSPRSPPPARPPRRPSTPFFVEASPRAPTPAAPPMPAVEAEAAPPATFTMPPPAPAVEAAPPPAAPPPIAAPVYDRAWLERRLRDLDELNAMGTIDDEELAATRKVALESFGGRHL